MVGPIACLVFKFLTQLFLSDISTSPYYLFLIKKKRVNFVARFELIMAFNYTNVAFKILSKELET